MMAGYLYDIGKVYIPLKIVEKQGKLNGEVVASDSATSPDNRRNS
jgi:response regulator RpfG family c-di-GMP phosphodiesterase